MKALTIPLALFASPTFADCEALSGVIRHEATHAAALFAPTNVTCGTARETTGDVLFCYSEHAFRSDQATGLAKRIEVEIIACFNTPTLQADTAVNHPDSYDARHFDVDGARVSLSVKDKGALGKTLVFLRIAKRT